MIVGLSEYIGLLNQAPVGGSIGVANANVESATGISGYLMNFSIVNIYRYCPDWRVVIIFEVVYFVSL